MDIVKEAFKGIYPDKELRHEAEINYSGKFKGYNANARLFSNKIVFNLSKNWRYVSNDIKIGLLQELMLKLFRIFNKKQTLNIELYNIFMKKIPDAVPKTKSHPLLENSFNRVNEKYFFGLVERPNLVIGNSLQKLGSYEFGTDTVMISRMLVGDERLMDYVMYHELLHKKQKFSSNRGRTRHHGKEFRAREKEFENAEGLEKEISKLVRKAKIKRKFGLFY